MECHQNDPFIHNSFIDAVKMPRTDEPEAGGRGDRFNGKSKRAFFAGKTRSDKAKQ